jgi:prepilin-type N-terminal cleavage/methylation domain-containing protein
MPPFKNSGFTLVEIMVSIVIMAIVSTAGVTVYNSAQRSARNAKRTEDLKQLRASLELYKSSTGKFPVQSGYACISSALASLQPTYIPTLPADPLDNGNPGGSYCYEYSADTAALTYELRANPGLANTSEGFNVSGAYEVEMYGADGTWCKDSDGNGDISTSGSCTDSGGTNRNDYCELISGRNYARDGYCTGSWNGAAWNNVHCEWGGYACATGAPCNSGVCTFGP